MVFELVAEPDGCGAMVPALIEHLADHARQRNMGEHDGSKQSLAFLGVGDREPLSLLCQLMSPPSSAAKSSNCNVSPKGRTSSTSYCNAAAKAGRSARSWYGDLANASIIPAI